MVVGCRLLSANCYCICRVSVRVVVVDSWLSRVSSVSIRLSAVADLFCCWCPALLTAILIREKRDVYNSTKKCCCPGKVFCNSSLSFTNARQLVQCTSFHITHPAKIELYSDKHPARILHNTYIVHTCTFRC